MNGRRLTSMAVLRPHETSCYWQWPFPALLLCGFRIRQHGACGRRQAPHTGARVHILTRSLSLTPTPQHGWCIKQTPSRSFGDGVFWGPGNRWIGVRSHNRFLRRNRVRSRQKQPIQSRQGEKWGNRDTNVESESVKRIWGVQSISCYRPCHVCVRAAGELSR